MRYYLGTGTEFIKAQCKEYKTLEGALKAAAKDESLVVWDENGKVIGSLTDNVPEGALQGEETETGEGNGEQHKGQNEPSGDVETGENGQEEGKATNTPNAEEKGVNEANSEPEQQEERDAEPEDAETIVPQGAMRVTVVCDGTLNLRRTASWNRGNECGRAARGQSYYVKAIYTVKGKKMVETVDGIFLSGQSEHVQFEQL